MKRCLVLLSAFSFCACGTAPAFSRDLRGADARPPALGSPAEAARSLRITVLGVGQGDAIIIEAPTGETMLVDAGPTGAGTSRILPALAAEGIDHLSAVILTHDHDDHTGGLYEVLAGPDALAGTADDIITEGGIHVDEEISLENGEPQYGWDEGAAPPDRIAVSPGDRLDLGEVDIEVLAARARLASGAEIDRGDPPDENADSIVLLLSYAGFRMLLTGDVTGGGGEPPYETPDVETPLAPLAGDIDVLKVAHHGSGTSTNQAFLDVTKPEVAIVSVGDGNDYGHPDPDVIERLLASGAEVYLTERGWLESDEPIVVGDDIVVEVDEDGGYRLIMQ